MLPAAPAQLNLAFPFWASLRSAGLLRTFQRVFVVLRIDDLPLANLPTNDCIAHPAIFKYLSHLRSLLRVDLKHTPDDMTALPR